MLSVQPLEEVCGIDTAQLSEEFAFFEAIGNFVVEDVFGYVD